MAQRKIQQDITKPFWTIEQAALHIGVEKRSIRRYIQDGLPSYFDGKFVKPREVVAEAIRRKKATTSTRTKKEPA